MKIVSDCKCGNFGMNNIAEVLKIKNGEIFWIWTDRRINFCDGCGKRIWIADDETIEEIIDQIVEIKQKNSFVASSGDVGINRDKINEIINWINENDKKIKHIADWIDREIKKKL